MSIEQKMATLKAALRSDEYEQVEGALFDGWGYCCLGLGEKVCLGVTFHQRFDSDGSPTPYFEDEFGYEDLLRADMAAELGFDKPITEDEIERAYEAGYHLSGGVDFSPGQQRQYLLAAANDGGNSFSRIADLIELLGWDKEDTV